MYKLCIIRYYCWNTVVKISCCQKRKGKSRLIAGNIIAKLAHAFSSGWRARCLYLHTSHGGGGENCCTLAQQTSIHPLGKFDFHGLNVNARRTDGRSALASVRPTFQLVPIKQVQ